MGVLPLAPASLGLVLLACVARGEPVAGREPAAGAERSADDATGPFATLELDLALQQEVFDDDFGALWDAGPAARVALATPLPKGFVELSATALEGDAARADLPRIRMVGTSLGWGADLALPSRMTLRGVARTGVWWMLFDATPSRPAQDENELSFGARVSLRRPFADRWSFEVGAEAVRVLTEPDLDFVFAGAGLARTFDMPRWLREGLQ